MDIKSPKLSTIEYREIAKLHSKYLNKGFLATLGIPFLTLLYEAIDEDSESVLIVERVDRVIVGFVAGTSGLGRLYKQLLFHPFRLIFSLKNSLLSPSKIYKIVEILFISKDDNASVDIPKHELLSIVVNPIYQGVGHAENLFKALCDHFKAEGVNSFSIIVGSNLDRAHAFYKKMGSIPLKEMQVHKGSNSVIYLKNLSL